MSRQNIAYILIASFAFSTLTFAQNTALVDAAGEFDVYGRIERTQKIRTEKLENGEWRTRAPLSVFADGERAIRLYGANARRSIPFGLSPRIEISSADLRLRHLTSVGLVTDNPHLRISINEIAIAQLPALRKPAVEVSAVNIDPADLSAGYNHIWLDGIHRYTHECQDPTAPELWSEVDARSSELEVVYRRRAFTGRLSELTDIVQPGFGGLTTLTILTPGAEPTRDHLLWGALSVQAIVNRMDGQLPAIDHRAVLDFDQVAGDALGATDLVLVGTSDQLEPFLGEVTEKITDAFLQLRPSPFDQTAFMLVVSGRTENDVLRAATVLNRLDYPLADNQEMLIPLAEFPLQTAPAYAPLVDTNAIYRLKDLGFTDTRVTQQSYGRFATEFIAPADYFASEGAEAVLSLDMAYGADLREDSALNVFLNGVFQTAVWLREPAGAVLPGYEIRIDGRAIKPGKNTLSFEVSLTPGEGGQCGLRSDRHLAFVLKDSSTLAFPKISHYAELPDLSLLRDTGFPFMSQNGDAAAVRLLDHDSNTIAAAWTVIAKIGTLTKSNPGNLDIDFGSNSPARAHTLFVGAAPAVSSSRLLENQNSQILDSVRLGRTGVISASRSPVSDNALHVLLTASTSDQLVKVTRSIVSPSHWSQLSGARTEWRGATDSVRVFLPSEVFQVGELGPRDRISFLNSKQPWRWVGIIAALLFALALLLTMAVRYLRSDDAQP